MFALTISGANYTLYPFWMLLYNISVTIEADRFCDCAQSWESEIVNVGS